MFESFLAATTNCSNTWSRCLWTTTNWPRMISFCAAQRLARSLSTRDSGSRGRWLDAPYCKQALAWGNWQTRARPYNSTSISVSKLNIDPTVWDSQCEVIRLKINKNIRQDLIKLTKSKRPPRLLKKSRENLPLSAIFFGMVPKSSITCAMWSSSRE